MKIFYQEISYQYTPEGKRDKYALGTDKFDLMIKTEKQVYKVGNRVELPFGETGTISQINGPNYTVRIRDSNFNITGNRTNQKVNFLENKIKKRKQIIMANTLRHKDEDFIGTTQESKWYGKFEILEKIDQTYKVRFVDTGYTAIFNKYQVIKGEIRDKSIPYKLIYSRGI